MINCVKARERFVTRISLTVACIDANATTSSQTWGSQQNMSVVPVIFENQQCENVQGNGQRSNWDRYFGRS